MYGRPHSKKPRHCARASLESVEISLTAEPILNAVYHSRSPSPTETAVSPTHCESVGSAIARPSGIMSSVHSAVTGAAQNPRLCHGSRMSRRSGEDRGLRTAEPPAGQCLHSRHDDKLTCRVMKLTDGASGPPKGRLFGYSMTNGQKTTALKIWRMS